MVARMPLWVPVPVDAAHSMTLFRNKRDFGITAAIMTAIFIAAAGAVTAAIAIDHTVQIASTLNELSASVAAALDTQASVSSQLKGGLMVVNQRIDLVQEQLEMLWQLARLGSEWKFPSLCITSIQYQKFTHAANLSQKLSQHLIGNWSAEFEDLIEHLRLSIATVNSMRVDAGLASGLSTWISTTMNHLKEWAGMGAMFGLLLLACSLGLWCICRMSLTQHWNAAIVQAFTAIEAGQSPQAWLTVMQE